MVSTLTIAGIQIPQRFPAVSRLLIRQGYTNIAFASETPFHTELH